ncbi:MAG: response regulator [Bacteriovoracia bacterium]
MNTPHSAFGQFSLLVVDDSDFARAQISGLLKDKGFNVVGEASGAEEALKLIKELKPHLVLTDIVMPNVSGIELAEKISSNFTNVGVIMISSLAHEQVVLEAIAAGAVDFVRKPIDVVQLTEAVEKYLTSIKKD